MFNGVAHHCYFCFGYNGNDVAIELAQVYDVARTGNPDVTEQTFDVFGIDDARALTKTAYLKPTGAHKLMVLSIGSITHEAQNALLKLLEEPPSAVRFAFVLPEGAVLLDTVLSRGVTIKNDTQQTQTPDVVTQTPAQRLQEVERIVKSEDAAQVEVFLNTLEQYAHANLPKTKLLSAHILAVRKALAMRGTSKKQLLESVVLLVS